VLVVLDADSDFSCELGPGLLERSIDAAQGKPVLVALAERNFEDWLYASAETLELGVEFDANKSGLGQVIQALRPTKYVKPTWQPRLASRMDVRLAMSRQASLARMLTRFEEMRASAGL
jgi:hypothetical protein